VPTSLTAWTGSWTMYVNGVSVGTQSGNYPMPIKRTDFYLGFSDWGDVQTSVEFDVVRIYDYALTQPVIQTLASQYGLATAPPPTSSSSSTSTPATSSSSAATGTSAGTTPSSSSSGSTVNPGGSSSSSISNGAIAGAVVGSVVGAAIIIGALCMCCACTRTKTAKSGTDNKGDRATGGYGEVEEASTMDHSNAGDVEMAEVDGTHE